MTFDEEDTKSLAPAEREVVDGADRLDAREGGDATEHLPVESHDRGVFVVLYGRKRQLQRERVIGAETRVDALDFPITPQHQACPEQQHRCEGELRRRDHRADAVSGAATNDRPRAFLEWSV